MSNLRSLRARRSVALCTVLAVPLLLSCQRPAPPKIATVSPPGAPEPPTTTQNPVPTVTVACAPEPDKPGPSSQPPLGLLRQPAVSRIDDKDLRTAVYAVGDFPANAPGLRPGPDDDRQLIDVYCVACHSTAYITMQPPLSRAQWEAEVAKMRSAFGAVVPDAAAQRIATFLHAYYGRK